MSDHHQEEQRSPTQATRVPPLPLIPQPPKATASTTTPSNDFNGVKKRNETNTVNSTSSSKADHQRQRTSIVSFSSAANSKKKKEQTSTAAVHSPSPSSSSSTAQLAQFSAFSENSSQGPSSARVNSTRKTQQQQLQPASARRPSLTIPKTTTTAGSGHVRGSPLGSIRNPFLRRKSRELTRQNSVKAFRAHYRRGFGQQTSWEDESSGGDSANGDSDHHKKSTTNKKKGKKRKTPIDEGQGVTDDVAAFNSSLRAKRYNAQLCALLDGNELESPPLSPIYDVTAKHSEERNIEQQLRTLQRRTHRQFVTEQVQKMNVVSSSSKAGNEDKNTATASSSRVAAKAVRHSVVMEHLPSIYLKKTNVPVLAGRQRIGEGVLGDVKQLASSGEEDSLPSPTIARDGINKDDDEDDEEDFYLKSTADNRRRLVIPSSKHGQHQQSQAQAAALLSPRHSVAHQRELLIPAKSATNANSNISKRTLAHSPILFGSSAVTLNNNKRAQKLLSEGLLEATYVENIDKLPALALNKSTSHKSTNAASPSSSPRQYIQERLGLMRLNPQLHSEFHGRCVAVQRSKDHTRDELTLRLDHKYATPREKFDKRRDLQELAQQRKSDIALASVKKGHEYIDTIQQKQLEAVEKRDYLANLRTLVKRWMVVMVLQKSFRRIRKKMRSGYFDRWKLLLVAYIARHWYRRMKARRWRIAELRLNAFLRKYMPAMVGSFRQKRKDAATPLIAKFLRHHIVVTRFVSALTIFFGKVRLAQRIVRRRRLAKLLAMLSLKASWDRENLRMFQEGKMQVIFPARFRDHVIANLLPVERHWYYAQRTRVVNAYVDELERLERQYFQEEERRLQQASKGRSKFLFGAGNGMEDSMSPVAGVAGVSDGEGGNDDVPSSSNSGSPTTAGGEARNAQTQQRDSQAAAALLDRSPSDLISVLNRRHDTHFSQLPELRNRRRKFFDLFLNGGFDVHKTSAFPVQQLGLYSLTDFPIDKLPKLQQRNFYAYHVRTAAELAISEQIRHQEEEQQHQSPHTSLSHAAAPSSSNLRRGTTHLAPQQSHRRSNAGITAAASSQRRHTSFRNPPQQQQQSCPINPAAPGALQRNLSSSSTSSSGVFRNLQEQISTTMPLVPEYAISPYVKPPPARNLSVLEQLMLKVKRPKLPRRKVFCLPSNMRLLLTMARTELLKASREYQRKRSGGGDGASSSSWKSTELQRNVETGQVQNGLSAVDGGLVGEGDAAAPDAFDQLSLSSSSAGSPTSRSDALSFFDDGDENEDASGDESTDSETEADRIYGKKKKKEDAEPASDDLASNAQDSHAMLRRYASKRKSRERKGVRKGHKLLATIDMEFLKRYVLAAK